MNWKRVTAATLRAGGDDTSDTDGEPDMTPEQLEQHRKHKAEQKREREKHAKMMELSYYLEMVDTKHRYGSHLRAYHAEWKKSNTNENFFYWLDQGEGRTVEVPNVTREKLEADQVRYLTREERLKYLVKIDKEGKLMWAKNGERINTSAGFRDSVDGIVPVDAASPTWSHDGRPSSSEDEDADASSMSAGSAAEEAQHYVNHDFKRAKGLKKLQKVSVAVIFNHLLQSTVKPGTWIFVADTSMRLYIGIKQSGAFQHSSFLHGARISSAGLIKVKDGQLRRLSPLSGHYRPPTRNFRAFVHSLKDSEVDMSHVSISRSYAVLLGLEAYQKSTKKLKDAEQQLKENVEKVTHPEEAAKREEEKQDRSKSAQKEREHLQRERTRTEELKRETSRTSRFFQRLGIRSKRSSIASPPSSSGGLPAQTDAQEPAET